MIGSKLALGLLMAGAASAAEIVRRDTGGGHSHGHHEAAAAPSSGYSEPAVASSGYAAPSTGYASSSSGGYEVSSYGAEEEPFPLSALLIPILIIAGLSLLFPTITSVAVRRKRDLEQFQSESNPMTDVLNRVNDIYMAVVESEECMERIACEVGGLASDFGIKEKSIVKMADPLVPTKYKTYYKQFKAGQDCQKIKCGSFSF